MIRRVATIAERRDDCVTFYLGLGTNKHIVNAIAGQGIGYHKAAKRAIRAYRRILTNGIRIA